MNGNIDAARQQCVVNFFGKQAFTANICKWNIKDLVARSLYWHELHCEPGPLMLESRFDPVRLPERQSTASRSEP
jgi:hypothetical protein